MNNFSVAKSLHDQILEYSGKDIPIGTGFGLSINDPIQMDTQENYGHTQCAIFSYYLRKHYPVAWDVVKQEIIIENDKHIDCVELSVSESPEDMKEAWNVKYYFDLTDCLEISNYS